MSLRRSKLPKNLAVAGVVIPIIFAAMWKYIYAHNLFPMRQVTPNYWSAPPIYWFLKDLTLALCPGEFIEIVTMDWTGFWGIFIMWLIAVALNSLLYYWLGRGIVALRERFGNRGAAEGGDD